MEAEQRLGNNVQNVVLGLFVFGLICVLIDHLAGGSKTPARAAETPQVSKPQSRGNFLEAFGMSKQFVTAHLKAPSTSDFPRFDNSFVSKLGEGRYRVSAYVDAQNAFGAQIRSQYTCVLSTQDGERWLLEQIDIH